MTTSTGASDFADLSAVALAERLARGELSAGEVVEASIARIEAVNPKLNAVVVKRYDEARAEARSADERRARGEPLGPLHGVPITVKECFDVVGTPATYGLPSRAQTLASTDDPYIARLRAAGAIIVGKTNVPQLLLYIEADNPLYGRTNNPWNLERTPGGSSGGQAAIIAAGGSPLGLGTDIGGSIRVPSSFCGVVGMKPTAGRVPDVIDFGVPLGQRAIVSQVGPLGRTVDDVALALEIINGGRTPDAEPPRPLGDLAAVDVSKLRVAYYTDDGILPVAQSVRRATVEAAGLLAARGAQVTEWKPPAVEEASDIFYRVLSADGGAGAKAFLGRNPRDPRIGQLVALAGAPRGLMTAASGALGLLGQRTQAAVARNFGYRHTLDYWRLVEAQMAYQRRFAHALDEDPGGPFDIIICPATALPAIRHGDSRDLVTAGAYATLYNVLGYPTGIVPVSTVRPGEEQPRKAGRDAAQRAARRAEEGSAGLPLAAQVVARPWREHVALAAMRVIEEAVNASGGLPRPGAV
ncbi:MAG TPA: amidase [Ktedonobacterales bacterium]|nr:amidase [Ktedonobacterales bacterium]